jgi:hypothetical protein
VGWPVVEGGGATGRDGRAVCDKIKCEKCFL